MVTGLLFSMPVNKNTIKNKELSILVFRDGFSFCSSDKQKFFDNKQIIQKDSNFENLLKQEGFLEAEKIQGIYFNQPATFVPTAVYQAQNKEKYLASNIQWNKQLSVAENESQDKKIKILYPFDPAIEKTLKSYFKTIGFSHYTQVLYDLLLESDRMADQVVMSLHLQDDRLDVFIFRGKALLFYNSYPYKNEKEFLYYVMAVAEELSLVPEAFEMVFLGKDQKYERLYKAITPYHSNISFADSDKRPLIVEDTQPAPYFTNLFA